MFQSTIDLAVGAVKRLKTVRHPSVLTYLDSKYVGTVSLITFSFQFYFLDWHRIKIHVYWPLSFISCSKNVLF